MNALVLYSIKEETMTAYLVLYYFSASFLLRFGMVAWGID